MFLLNDENCLICCILRLPDAAYNCNVLLRLFFCAALHKKIKTVNISKVLILNVKSLNKTALMTKKTVF